MSFSQSGSSITQSGTDTDLSGLTGVTGVTTITVGDVTVYVIASNNLIITGTCTFDPTLEMVCITSTSISNALYINGGTLNIGSEVTSSLGTGLKPLYQPATAFIIGTESTAATSGYCINVTATGTLNWYGAIISVNSSQVWADGATIKIRDGVLFSRRFSTNNRIRIEGGTNVDINGLTTYGIQADWLITEDFGQFANYTALDKSIPTECAISTAGERAWETLPDNSHAADASMSNWKAFLDITITNAEAGSRSLIVPDNTNTANGSTFHGGRLYHEFTVSCKDTLNAPIESAVCYLIDYDNGMRVTTDSYSTGLDIDETDDQVFTPLTGSAGITSVQTLLTAMYYRTNGVDDINIPDGQERVDYRGKPRAVNASIGSVSTVSATFGSTDDSLPALPEGTRFVLEDSTSNDEQTWETTEDWTTSGGDADRLSGNATAETENAMSMSVLGEDNYDVYVWSYEHLPYKFTDATMNGLTQSDLVATMLSDLGITQANRTTVGAYTTLDDLSELYDYQKDYKCDASNVTEPSIDTAIAVASGTIVDFGDIEIVIDGDAASVFVFAAGATDTVTIKTTDLSVSSKFDTLKTTESVTMQDGAVVSGGITIDSDVYLNSAEDLADVTITGDLFIDTGANSTLDFSGVTVLGDVYNDDATHTLIIDCTNCSLTAGDPGTGNGQTDVQVNVPIKVIVKDVESGDLLQNARVLLEAAAGGDLPYADSVTITRSGTVATVTHTAHGLATGDYVIILGATQNEYNGDRQITYIGVNSYSFVVSGSPATPATGTIVATARIVNELTDAFGEVNKIHRYTSDQPVRGVVRKGTV